MPSCKGPRIVTAYNRYTIAPMSRPVTVREIMDRLGLTQYHATRLLKRLGGTRVSHTWVCNREKLEAWIHEQSNAPGD